MIKNKTIQPNYNAYQPYMLLDFTFSFEKDIAHDDICRSVIEITEGINIAKYVDFSHRNAHGYDAVMMFKLIVLAFTLFGYASTRQLERLCKTDDTIIYRCIILVEVDVVIANYIALIYIS